MTVRTILVKFAGDATELTKSSKAARTGLQKFESGVNKASVAIVGAATAAGGALLKIGDDFNSGFNAIRIGTGATGEALQDLQDNFKNVAGRVTQDIGQTAQTLADFNTMTGATGEHLEQLTETYLNLEKITGSSIGIDKVTRVFGDWDIAVEGQVDAMDRLFRVSQTTGIGVDDLATKVVQFGAPLRNMGFDFEHATALFGKWQKEGVNTETVMSGLRTAAGKWAREGKDLPTTLQETIDKIQGAGSAAKAQEIALANFGARAGPDLAAAILEGRFGVDDLMESLSGNTDTINGLAEETLTWQDQLKLLKNEGLTAIQPLATAVFDQLDRGIGLLKQAISWGERNTGTVKALGIALGVIAGVVLAVNVGLKVYHGIMMVVRAATLVWTGIQWALNAAFLANPLTWIILAIVALIAVIVLIATKTTWFQTAWEAMSSAVVAAAKAVWKFIKEVLWEKGIKRYFDLIAAIILWVVGKFQSGFDRAKKAGSNMIDFVKSIPGRIKDAFARAADFITAPFRAGFSAVKGLWNSTLGGKGFTIPSWVPGVGGNRFEIPRFHSGGIVQGRPGTEVPILAMPGERISTREEDLTNQLLTAVVPIDLGEGITQVVELKLRRGGRQLVRRVMAGAGAA